MKPPDGYNGDTDPLSPDRWLHVRSIVEEALALPGEARSAFLEIACGGDAALRRRVERLIAACDRADDNWGFLAQPAGELAAPLLADFGSETIDPAGPRDGLPAAFSAALAGRYEVGAEIGRGGMATVYLAEDLRHHRRVAMKVLDRQLGAMLGTERFLTEIEITAGLQHPNILPLFDSGEAGGLLYYVMPLIEGGSLRARLHRERQLPVEEAVRIVRVIAGALDYAHRRGVVHRDLKPENVLLQDGQPLLADFGISLAVARAAGSRETAAGISLGTPRYMSPEQAAVDPAIDGRSDLYSLACVLYELLAGDPPFTGSKVEVVVAKVVGEAPAGVRTVRPSVPVHVEAALARGLARLPADRQTTVREFADTLVAATITAGTTERATPGWRRDAVRHTFGAAAIVGMLSAAWLAARPPDAPVSRFVERDLIDQASSSAVTLTPDGRALVYTGTAEAGGRLVLRPLDDRPQRALAGTEGASHPSVAPDGRRLAYISSDGQLKTIAIDGGGTAATPAWRYGGEAWIGDSAIIRDSRPGLLKIGTGGDTLALLTRVDSAGGERLHTAALLLPDMRAMVFTVRSRGGPGIVEGRLAIASVDPRGGSPAPHSLLGVTARRAIAFVDGWLLYISADGNSIQAVPLDIAGGRVSGQPISVLEDEAGNLETGSLADNGTLLYLRRPRANSAVLVDSSGAVHPGLARPEGSFMYPRLSPDGKRFAVQVTSAGGEDDVWVYDIASRTPTRLTTSGLALHPTWTPDGHHIVYMTRGSRELMSQPVNGGAATSVADDGFAPTVVPDGRSVVFQRGPHTGTPWGIWSAPLSGKGNPRKVLDRTDAYMPAVSADGQWLAYVSGATGRDEVYVSHLHRPGPAVQVSDGGGIEPVWSPTPDGDRIYYRTDDALMVAVITTPLLAVVSRRQLFTGAFDGAMPHRNYDIRPDGSAFLMIAPVANPEAVVTLNWLPRLREQLARER